MKISKNIDQYIDKSAKDISQFNRALREAELKKSNGVLTIPRKKLLQDIYEAVKLDTHLTGAWMNRKSNILGEQFTIKNRGIINEEKSKLFQNKKWFTNFISFAIDALLHGYSLIELSDLNEKGEVDSVKLIPRANSIPELDWIVKKPSDLVGVDVSDYTDYVFVKSQNLNGLLESIAPLVLYKRFSFGAWSNFHEQYANPTIIGKTSVKDSELFQNMMKSLQSFGQDRIIGIDLNDNIEVVKVTADVHFTFRSHIEMINSEISKAILGSTLTMDNNNNGAAGSYSLGEVHKDSLKQLVENDVEFVEQIVNDTLIPRLIEMGGVYSDLTEEDRFAVNVDVRANYQARVNLFTTLLNYYDIDPLLIEKEFDVESEFIKKKSTPTW